MNIKKYLVLKNYKNYFKDYFRDHLGNKYVKSYSQCGEDLLISYALATLGIKKPTYLDIGTHHPVLGNNTFLFYSRGSRGLCVEPNPKLFKVIKSTRNHDICLNAGIAPSSNGSANYYMMSLSPLNTFLKAEADRYSDRSNGRVKIEKIIKIPLITINTLMAEYFPKSADIISLDAEGYDFEIIKSLDLKKYRPKVICIESARYDANRKIQKQTNILEYLIGQGYFLYADTYINSILVDKRTWTL